MPHIGSVFDGIGDLELCLSSNQVNLIAEAEKTAGNKSSDKIETEFVTISPEFFHYFTQICYYFTGYDICYCFSIFAIASL